MEYKLLNFNWFNSAFKYLNVHTTKWPFITTLSQLQIKILSDELMANLHSPPFSMNMDEATATKNMWVCSLRVWYFNDVKLLLSTLIHLLHLLFNESKVTQLTSIYRSVSEGQAHDAGGILCKARSPGKVYNWENNCEIEIGWPKKSIKQKEHLHR